MKLIFSFIIKAAIIVYQKVFSPLMRPSCRYIPTCSQYGLDALAKHGPFKASKLIIKRIFRCSPWGGHGHDPVP
jgi:putative membrane protein insertion efficiency factor